MSHVWTYAAAIIPSIGVAFLFYVIIKHILEGDRNERVAQARWEKAHDRSEGTDPQGRPVG
ncbi:MAG: lysyl-tRNA synthetase [Tetrasphaera sp.]|jgi:hypothetical protein|nr:lysyl-tRNA synthetase [Tetrasphaera sp.]